MHALTGQPEPHRGPSLQIAILLSPVAALLKKKPVWCIGLCSGAAGLVYFANGFVLFF